MKIKRILICLLITALTCSMTACTTTTTTPNESKEPIPPISTEQTPENPDYITEQATPPLADKSYDSLEDLSNALGYTVQYPTSSTTYGVKNNSLELMFFNGKVMAGRLIKARIGNPPETDFYGYVSTKTETRENISYTVHYTNEDECHLITWSENDFLYLMYTSNIHTINSIIEIAQQIQ